MHNWLIVSFFDLTVGNLDSYENQEHSLTIMHVAVNKTIQFMHLPIQGKTLYNQSIIQSINYHDCVNCYYGDL